MNTRRHPDRRAATRCHGPSGVNMVSQTQKRPRRRSGGELAKLLSTGCCTPLAIKCARGDLNPHDLTVTRPSTELSVFP
jgi:hypothetical protein